MPETPKKLYEPNRIKEWREARGLQQDELAEKVRTTAATIGKLERRERRLSTGWLMRIAQALDVHPFDLLDMAAMAGGPDLIPSASGPHARALSQRGLRFYDVVTDVLIDAGYPKGQTILADHSAEALAKLHTGNIVVVEMGGAKPFLALRIFIAPDLLTTNRTGGNIAQKVGKNKILAVLVPENHTNGSGR